MCVCVCVVCRLSTIRHADCIIVMEGGGVVEMGSHDYLLKQEGVYYDLVHAQVSSTSSVASHLSWNVLCTHDSFQQRV